MAARNFTSDVFPELRQQPGFTDMQRIPGFDWIWIGPGIIARSPVAMIGNGITHVVAANGDAFASAFHGKLALHVVDVEDHPDEDILVHLDACVAFIDTCRAVGGNVLVYCTAGISRSASVVTAYLVAKGGLSVDAALATVRAARPWVKPNPGFMDQLQAYADKQLHGGTRVAACELCLRRPVSKQYQTSHPRFVIIACETCDCPMLVLRSHDSSQVSAGLLSEMSAALSAVATEVYGTGIWWIDTQQRSIPDHLHWHTRGLGRPKL